MCIVITLNPIFCNVHFLHLTNLENAGILLDENVACVVYFVLEADIAGRISRPQDKPPCHQRWRAWPTVLTDC